jgi:hypothetical protein
MLAGHPQRVAEKQVLIAADEQSKCVTVTSAYAGHHLVVRELVWSLNH